MLEIQLLGFINSDLDLIDNLFGSICEEKPNKYVTCHILLLLLHHISYSKWILDTDIHIQKSNMMRSCSHHPLLMKEGTVDF